MSNTAVVSESETSELSDFSTAAILKNSIAAGVPPEQVVAPWLEYCLASQDLAAAREAIETCAPGLALTPLPPGWTWTQILTRSAKLRSLLHITHFYQLDDLLIENNSAIDADGILRQAISAFDQYSGPVLRLAQRLYERKERAEGDAVLIPFLLRNPADMQCVQTYARQVAASGATAETNGILGAAIKNEVPAELLVGPWIESHLRSNNLKDARQVVESCAKLIGLGNLPAQWTWAHVLANSDKLSQLNLTVIYMLDDALIAANQKAEANMLLRECINANPQLSGPVLRLAQRLEEQGETAEAEKLLGAFLARVPSDVHATVTMARRAADKGAVKNGVKLIKTAIDAGAPPHNLVGMWLEMCVAQKDMPGARKAVEACAGPLGLEPLPWGWTWPQALERSSTLAKTIHLNLYYQLDDQHVAVNDVASADAILRVAIANNPSYSGPVLRLAQRLYERGDEAEADKITVDFLRRHPGDLQAAAMYARYAARRQAGRLRR